MRLDPEVLGHYARSRERERLDTGVGRPEELRTRGLLSRWPPPAPATVLDVGGGAGRYAISRWASTADGFVRGLLADPEFAELVRDDVRTGVHRNPGRRAGWFTTA